jgi:dTDP-4-amino-4,6-dideoxygalactose transaminase
MAGEARENFLPFALPDVDGEELSEIREVLESNWVTTGPKVKDFERLFAAAVGARHAIAVNSCTAAMHLGLEALGVGSGDEVITTPYTFAATAEVIRYFDARPVFVDIDPRSFNMNPDLLEQKINSRTKAIIPVHIAGLPVEMDALLSVASKHRIPIIEDAAHAFPSVYKGRYVGNLSDLTCFSFYATKTITTGEGGMICTNNDQWADRCRIMSLHGISRDAWKRYTAEGTWYYEIIAPGFKYNMTDVAAAMGLAQLRKADRMLERRAAIAARFSSAFGQMEQLEVPFDRSDSQHAWHLYMLRLNLHRLRIDRAEFMNELRRRNIGASVHFIPLHTHPYYREQFGYKPDDFPVAYNEYLREVSLPIYSKMTDRDVQDVIDAVSAVVREFRVSTVR